MNPYDIEKLAGKHVTMCGGKAKRKVREIESAECKELYKWAEQTVIDGILIADYLAHIPNEGKRGPKAQRDFSEMGGTSGYPDYVFDVARCGYHGLRIEMKAPEPNRSVISDSQMKMAERLTQQGYLVLFTKGFEIAKQAIIDYMAGKL
ncbi:VRR-NUC domain-containing protein [Vibrio cholerae]|uniref:VRR-NUC domain-containing protein n=1 Tax=Vibrio cholerae TaxID=666 RepID=UPI000BA8DE65|nr:VRR-NUC domain-containing protein [Vibrio cholerae]EKF9624974.1 VRR-NUC domain-containing protein [Vibrio cholerae]EKF9647558.1 VRR-NUC domain-containing protein [Vibrio cholerae]EKF9648851.1 VRR-NUC domain-containing protein [Vibrio cholerae]MEB5538605.1 VRR-NUC domain-containing protein [Vibrio cholerae]MEB5547240.1 VRR-NUC domain-containing protein [Vibrio cholerae]